MADVHERRNLKKRIKEVELHRGSGVVIWFWKTNCREHLMKLFINLLDVVLSSVAG